MTDTPDSRRQKILHWLQEQKSLAIDELVNRLDVSAMTIHRDLDLLAKEGLVQKSYGHVVLKDTKTEIMPSPDVCALCQTRLSHRSDFVIQMAQGELLQACCPHCGLLLMRRHTVTSALTRDFISFRMVNVTQAIFVLDSRVHLCCVPSVLCFATRQDAESFERGFGGTVLSFEDTLHHLEHSHSHPIKPL